MIEGLSIVGLWVLDQDEALAFYTEQLGFGVGADVTMGEYRWVTVTPPGHPDVELALDVPRPPAIDEESAAQIRSLVARGMMTGGVFTTDDCQQTYDELVVRGVEFLQPPIERPYGIDAAFRDNSGNHWRISQSLRPS